MDFAEAFQQQPQAPPEEGYIILTDPMIDYESEDGLGDLDQIQNDEGQTINERSPRGLRLNEENEEPVELQGLDNLPLERSKYYALLNDYENEDSELPPLGIDETCCDDRLRIGRQCWPARNFQRLRSRVDPR